MKFKRKIEKIKQVLKKEIILFCKKEKQLI